ncbi:MAG: glycerol-3-phosphate acyltransferase [Parolsenella sp.]|uniref:glycerol-3-phosphate acyltransferase n=1 Tax=Parolsenella sp. TaxID=2083006 RepID=UPI002E769AF0|nr:glycerol-3-phosphate acyltransferase [Parolsenella sp.]MEE1372080.1 glycerol-3-phosphate acyltransferase [Parolsenella sp.]
MTINYPVLVAYLVITFLVCGIPFGKIIARAKGIDIQKVGSGNIGTTNVAREIGKGAAALTLLLDAGKGALATGLALWFFPTFITGGASVAPHGDVAWLEGLITLAAICGHIFSPFLHFHGGKGIAVGVGTLLGFAWPVGLMELAIFLVIAVASKRVSAGSVTVAAILGPVFALIYGPNLGLDLLLELAGLVVVWAHRSNIKKLVNGQEKEFSFHKRGDKPAPDDDTVGESK